MGRRPKNQSIQPPTVLAKILVDLRRQHKLTMQEFASRLNVSAAYICRLEAGERRPSRDFITHLALTFYPEGSGPEQDELLVAAGYTPLHFRRFIGRDDVIHVFERAIERDPENFKQFIELVLILIKSGRFEQAEQRIQQGMNFYDDQVRLQVLVAASELAKGNFELALQYQNEALKYFLLEADHAKLNLKQQDLHHTLGVTHFMKGYRHIDRYLLQQEADTHGQQERQLAVTHLLAARDQFAQALALDAEDVYTLDEYARTFFNLAYLDGETDPNLWKETIAAFEAVLYSDDKESLGYQNLLQSNAFLAHAYTKSGEIERASHHIHVVEACLPNFWLIHYIKACFYSRKMSLVSDASQQQIFFHQKGLLALKKACAISDNGNRARSEALLDPDLKVLRDYDAEAFAAVIKEPGENLSA